MSECDPSAHSAAASAVTLSNEGHAFWPASAWRIEAEGRKRERRRESGRKEREREDDSPLRRRRKRRRRKKRRKRKRKRKKGKRGESVSGGTLMGERIVWMHPIPPQRIHQTPKSDKVMCRSLWTPREISAPNRFPRALRPP